MNELFNNHLLNNYFSILRLEEKFNVSDSVIRKRYFEAQTKYQDSSIAQVIIVNEAYQNLIDPMLRAKHIFQLNNMLTYDGITMRAINEKTTFKDMFEQMVKAFEEKNLVNAYSAWCNCRYLSIIGNS